MKKKVNNTNVFITKGDALQERSDMLINWTIPRLNGGDKLFFRIHDQGSSTIYKDCQRILASLKQKESEGSGVAAGKAVVTTAGILPAKFIIHAVIPDSRAERPDEQHRALLQSTISNIFLLITQYNSTKERINKVIFTPVSSFIYGSQHNSNAAQTLISALLVFAETCEMRTIKIVCETPEEYNLYSKELYKQTSSGIERFINKLFKLSI